MFGPATAETVDLTRTAIGELPAGFDTARTGSGAVGVWAVVNEPEVTAGRALEQRTPDETDYRFPLAIYKDVTAKNVDVSVHFKPIYGKIDQAGGIAVRLADQNNYYVVRANALEDNVRFYRVVGGKRQQLASADTKVAKRVWHTLRLRAEGDRFTIWFDGIEVLSATDRTFGAEGRVALWTKADSITRFDQLAITELP